MRNDEWTGLSAMAPAGDVAWMKFTGASVLRSRSLVLAQSCPIVSGVDDKGVYCLRCCLYALFYPDTVRQDCNVTSDPLVRNTCAIGVSYECGRRNYACGNF